MRDWIKSHGVWGQLGKKGQHYERQISNVHTSVSGPLSTLQRGTEDEKIFETNILVGDDCDSCTYSLK